MLRLLFRNTLLRKLEPLADAHPARVEFTERSLEKDGQRFASGETASDFTVPADGDARFAISVDLNLLQTAPQLLSIVHGGSRQDIRYDLDGRLAVDIPFTPPIKYRNSGTIQVNAESF